jgi:hypothetical protein
VAIVVARHFGMNGLSSLHYNALHCAAAEMIINCLERIRNTAAEIIQAVETEPIHVL